MTSCDIWMSIGIGLGTGFISGLVSGYLSGYFVTKQFKTNEEKDLKERTYYNGLYSYYEYLRSIKNELGLLIKPIENEEQKELKRLLSNYRKLFHDIDVDDLMDLETEKLIEEIGHILI